MSVAVVRPRPLTARQREVIRLVARGESNKEIGQRLGITEQGVKAHISRLLERHGAANRVELVHLTRAWEAAEESGAEPDAVERGLSSPTHPEVLDRITRLARALRELDVAIDLTRELPADAGTGPLSAVVRRRVRTARALADELMEAFGARADAL